MSHCMRGLEDLSSSSSSSLSSQYAVGGGRGLKESGRIRRQNAIEAVLDEQDHHVEKVYRLYLQHLLQVQQQQQQQHEQEQEQLQILNSPMMTNTMMNTIYYDDIKIRDVYRNCTRCSEDIAYCRGLIDAADAVQEREREHEQRLDDDDDDDLVKVCQEPTTLNSLL
jgi:hypothetical protein